MRQVERELKQAALEQQKPAVNALNQVVKAAQESVYAMRREMSRYRGSQRFIRYDDACGHGRMPLGHGLLYRQRLRADCRDAADGSCLGDESSAC